MENELTLRSTFKDLKKKMKGLILKNENGEIRPERRESLNIAFYRLGAPKM